MTEEEPRRAPFLFWHDAETAWSRDVGNGSVPCESASKESVCTGRRRVVPLHEMASLHMCNIRSRAKLMKLTWRYNERYSNLPSLPFLSYCRWCVSAQRYAYSILWSLMPTFTKHFWGFYGHFYRHTWKLHHKGHKLKYYECYKSAQHLAKQQSCWIVIRLILILNVCLTSKCKTSCFILSSNVLSLLILTLSLYEVTETSFKLNSLPVSLCIYSALILHAIKRHGYPSF